MRKKNRILFEEMLQSSYKYSSSIDAKGKENSTESLFMTLIFEQYKKWSLIQTIIIISNNNCVKDGIERSMEDVVKYLIDAYKKLTNARKID